MWKFPPAEESLCEGLSCKIPQRYQRDWAEQSKEVPGSAQEGSGLN